MHVIFVSTGAKVIFQSIHKY